MTSLVSRLTSSLRNLKLSWMPVAVARSPSPSATQGPAAKRQRVETAEADAGADADKPTEDPSTSASRTSTASFVSSTGKVKAKPSSPQRSFRPLPDEPTPEQLAEVEAMMALAVEADKRDTYAYQPNYRDTLVLAPMVRSGTLPVRLLSLYHGAGLVWTPEIVDKAIIGAQRDVDTVTGVVTYHKGGGAIWTTHPIEKPFVIFQIGSSDPELAVKAALTVAQDVSGIDLNCGCPKPFSTHSGMGAALLSTPDLLLDILRALVANVPLPISAKIRLMPTRAETLLLAARILRTGISNLTVHCRTRDMRPGEKAIHARLAEVVELGRRRGLPVICNGDGEGYANWDAIRTETGATSVMLARSAERNPSVFRPAGPLCATTMLTPQLLNVASHIQNNWGNTKFLLTMFKPSPPPIGKLSKTQKKEAMECIARAKTIPDVVRNFSNMGLGEHFVVNEAVGKEFMDELKRRLEGRPEWNVWAERVKAVEDGVVVDAPERTAESSAVSVASADDEEAAMNAAAVAEEEAMNAASAAPAASEEEAANEPVRATA